MMPAKDLLRLYVVGIVYKQISWRCDTMQTLISHYFADAAPYIPVTF